ncbi:MAG: hypothetical protein IJ583_01475 [Firmicutes bacterium]|nr:hypothetical protein [Bacillota bacterium]
MSEVKIEDVNISELVDIKDVEVNINSPKNVKIKSFIRQIKNPYIYKCGKFVVKISFEENDKNVRDRLREYIASL